MLNLSNLFKKKKYVVRYCRKIHGTWTVLKQIKYIALGKIITLGKKTYPINPKFPAHKDKGALYYYVDYDGVKGQLCFQDVKSLVNPEGLNLLVKQTIIEKIATGIQEQKFDYTTLTLGILIGAGITGLVLMILFYVGVF